MIIIKYNSRRRRRVSKTNSNSNSHNDRIEMGIWYIIRKQRLIWNRERNSKILEIQIK